MKVRNKKTGKTYKIKPTKKRYSPTKAGAKYA